MFNIHLAADLLRNLPVKKSVNRLRFDRTMVMSPRPRFLAHPVSAMQPDRETTRHHRSEPTRAFTFREDLSDH